MGGPGKRAGVRPKRSLTPRSLALAGAGVVALILWAGLVWSAIHFGSQARGGDQNDWWWTGAATIGAIVALFACLILLNRLRQDSPTTRSTTQAPGSAPGGKRAAR